MKKIEFSFEEAWSIKTPGRHLLEGPALSPDGERVYFTDCFEGQIYSFDPREPTVLPVKVYSYAPYFCNGIQCLTNDKLVVCLWKGLFFPHGMIHELDLSDCKNPLTTERVTLSTTNKNFRHPNDLAVDENKGVYFTDFRSGHVYYHAATEPQAKSCKKLCRPNGIELQMVSDEARSLYVSDSKYSTVFQYEIKDPGILGEIIQSYRLPEKGAVDGMALSPDGHLFVAQKNAVYALDSNLKLIDHKPLLTHNPPKPSNVFFVDSKTFFVTSYRALFCPKPAELYRGTISNKNNT